MSDDHRTTASVESSRPALPAARCVAIAMIALSSLLAAYAALPVDPAGAAKRYSGTFVIENGWPAVATAEVTLLSQVRWATLMRVKNEDDSYSAWEPYVVSRTWTLSAGDGLKSVEAQFKGAQGTKVTLADEIVLDTTGPVTTSDGDGLPHRAVTVTFTARDALSEVASTWYRLDGGAWQEGTSTTLFLWHRRSRLAAGDHTLEFYSTDVLGNVGATGATIVTLQY